MTTIDKTGPLSSRAFTLAAHSVNEEWGSESQIRAEVALVNYYEECGFDLQDIDRLSTTDEAVDFILTKLGIEL